MIVIVPLALEPDTGVAVAAACETGETLPEVWPDDPPPQAGSDRPIRMRANAETRRTRAHVTWGTLAGYRARGNRGYEGGSALERVGAETLQADQHA